MRGDTYINDTITETDYGFTGQENNSDIGWMNYNARWYSPTLGRFTQPDTITPNLYNPQSLNRYSYTLNNPVKYNDPSGHRHLEPDEPVYPEPDPIEDDLDNPADVTEWLAIELPIQAKALEQDNDYYRNACRMTRDPSACNVGYLYGRHLDLFNNKGKYDIKLNMRNLNKESAVVLCGKDDCSWVDYSAPGNIMYGYLSAAAGIPQGVSWFVGGARESLDNKSINMDYISSWFDNPGDKAAVDFGYQLYETYGDDMTLSEFQEALSIDVLNSFQQPQTIPLDPPIPEKNIYPQGDFLN